MHQNVRFFRQMTIFNYNLPAGQGCQMILDSVKIETVTEEGAAIINAGITQIDPGKVTISGGVTLDDWRSDRPERDHHQRWQDHHGLGRRDCARHWFADISPLSTKDSDD
jgi:hypothetical protein